jgi:hypothetical protein
MGTTSTHAAIAEAARIARSIQRRDDDPCHPDSSP